uniref:Uncharacterized protein n=1 Tax=Arundo donax TaxID=35708 RepID=A0A0A9UNP0_ARUDO
MLQILQFEQKWCLFSIANWYRHQSHLFPTDANQHPLLTKPYPVARGHGSSPTRRIAESNTKTGFPWHYITTMITEQPIINMFSVSITISYAICHRTKNHENAINAQ